MGTCNSASTAIVLESLFSKLASGRLAWWVYSISRREELYISAYIEALNLIELIVS